MTRFQISRAYHLVEVTEGWNGGPIHGSSRLNNERSMVPSDDGNTVLNGSDQGTCFYQTINSSQFQCLNTQTHNTLPCLTDVPSLVHRPAQAIYPS